MVIRVPSLAELGFMQLPKRTRATAFGASVATLFFSFLISRRRLLLKQSSQYFARWDFAARRQPGTPHMGNFFTMDPTWVKQLRRTSPREFLASSLLPSRRALRRGPKNVLEYVVNLISRSVNKSRTNRGMCSQSSSRANLATIFVEWCMSFD